MIPATQQDKDYLASMPLGFVQQMSESIQKLHVEDFDCSMKDLDDLGNYVIPKMKIDGTVRNSIIVCNYCGQETETSQVHWNEHLMFRHSDDCVGDIFRWSMRVLLKTTMFPRDRTFKVSDHTIADILDRALINHGHPTFIKQGP